MSEHNITVQGGSSVRLPTAGKYCDRDIVVTAEGGGVDLPALTNPASEAEVFDGYEYIDGAGAKKSGTFTVEEEIAEQDSLIPEILSALEGKAAGDIEPIALTGAAKGLQGPFVADVFERFSRYIVADKLQTVSEMFYKFQGKSIPFELTITATKYISFYYMFYGCDKLEALPKINGAYPSQMNNLCDGCRNLRVIPEEYFDSWNLSRLLTYSASSCASMFRECYSLRKVPGRLLSEAAGAALADNRCLYSYGFFCCYCLDEIVDANTPTSVVHSNAFNNSFYSASRLKRLVFLTAQDGTPLVRNWKAQTLDLSSYVGYAPSAKYITGYNSGITADKEVKDSATYQALKNDPDWFSVDVAYSRYNHDSAVETINSLPDTSAYLAEKGGTNTIKFKGAAGSATDGGAISDLTEAEIAVAAAKGWTVTLV